MKKKTLIKAWVIATVSILTLSVGAGVFVLKGGANTTHDRHEFERVVESTNKDTRGSAYYRGRKGEYDYFQARWNLGRKNMKIQISDSPVVDPIDYTSDENKWRGESFMHLTGEDLSSAIEQKFGAAGI